MSATEPEPEPAGTGPLQVARWVGLAFGALAVLLVPWTIYLAITLPARATATHYAMAWVGFDIGLVAALAWTAYLTWRRHLWLPIAASLTATMLLIDAWFDVTTAPDRGARFQAIASALLLELPLAVACFWLAQHAQDVISRRIAARVRREERRDPSNRKVLGRLRGRL